MELHEVRVLLRNELTNDNNMTPNDVEKEEKEKGKKGKNKNRDDMGQSQTMEAVNESVQHEALWSNRKKVCKPLNTIHIVKYPTVCGKRELEQRMHANSDRMNLIRNHLRI